jgi:hypothetical protein
VAHRGEGFGPDRQTPLPRVYGRGTRAEGVVGVCAICGETKPLTQDHCHDTGLTRDLLCQSCNKGLGFFRDRADMLATARDYLAQHAAVHARVQGTGVPVVVPAASAAAPLVTADGLELGRVWYAPPAWHPGGWPHASRWVWRDWEAWLLAGGWKPAAIEQYRKARDYWGVRDPREKGKWLYQPTPMQVLGHEAREAYVLLGGARGGGKSAYLRWEMHRRCLAVPGTMAILFRRELEELKLYHITRGKKEILILTTGPDGKPRGRSVGDEYLDYGNGSRAYWGHAKDVGDEAKYLGSEWDDINVDQMEQFVSSQLVDIFASGRSAEIAGMMSVVRGTANPGGPDPQWIIDRFLTKKVPGADEMAYQPSQWRYIPARVYDNPYLMDPDGSFRTYEGRLAQYGPVRRRQMLLGDWTAREGQFFPELEEARHRVTVAVPEGSKWMVALGYGYHTPGCLLAVAITPQGRLVVTHEQSFQYEPLGAVASRITMLGKKLGVTWATVACAPTLEPTTTTVETAVQTLRRAGVPAVAVDKAPYVGWLRLRAWWANAPDGQPWCVVDPSCETLWRALTTAVCDPTKPEELHRLSGHAVAAEALRDLVMSMPQPSAQRAAAADHPKGSVGAMIKQAQRTGGKRVARIL